MAFLGEKTLLINGAAHVLMGLYYLLYNPVKPLV